MKKSRFTELQIAYTLRLAEQGTPAVEVCRKLGVSEPTFYAWKKKYAGMGVSIGRACAAGRMSRAAWYKLPLDRLARDHEEDEALIRLTGVHRRWGFWMSYDRLRLERHLWNHKREYRVDCELGLKHRRRTKKRLPARGRQLLDTPSAPNAVWAIDFMSDALYVGRRFLTLNVLDEGVREALAIEIDTSLPGDRADIDLGDPPVIVFHIA